MGNIVLLDELTINKIAAGEVIERPASVIKEMVENSIDAGATNIIVEIKNGGISYIKITDNGKGIAKDDLEMAFERHATSKIRNADDLNVVTSMGFRGEALASIAAIANVEMVSKTKEQDVGYKVVVEAGNILEKEEIGCQNGTSIIVKNLFFNTPVRYKFLKKDYTETGYIEDVVTQIALVNPNIAFKLINSGKTIIQTSGNGDMKSVIYSIYGKDIAEGVIEVNYKYEDIMVSGVIGKPEISRSNRSNQLFFVNKRHIKDKTLSAATEQAYKGMIPIGKFGFVVLNLEMLPSKVDVNVHPAKLEVRFQEENKVFQAIYHTIKDGLLKADLVSNTSKEDIIIQNNEETKKFEEVTRPASSGLFSWKKNKPIEQYTEEESKMKTNIIEDLYNTKKLKELPKQEISTEEQADNEKIVEQEKENIGELESKTEQIDNPVDTSDVLKQLRQMQEDLKKEKDSNEEETKEQGQTIPNASTYTYFGENKEKVESLLRQLHPNVYSNKQNTELENKIENNVINVQEPKIIELNENSEEQLLEENIQEVKQENLLQETDKVLEENQNDIDDTKKVEIPKEEKTSTNFNEMYEKLFGRPVITDKEENKENKEESAVDIIKDNVSVFEDIEEYKTPTYKFIGIVFNTYIIVEIEKEMYIIDQHAAHERIMYEKVKQNYYSESNKDSQMLLLPDVITLSHKEMEIAKENFAMFEKAGFSLEEFGENTIKLTGVPTVCLDLDTKELFLETLDEINTVARTAKQEKEEKFIATVACKAAVKANMALTIQEVDSLMNKLLQLPNPFTCPHGRPTAIKMTKYDIERKFARK